MTTVIAPCSANSRLRVLLEPGQPGLPQGPEAGLAASGASYRSEFVPLDVRGRSAFAREAAPARRGSPPTELPITFTESAGERMVSGGLGSRSRHRARCQPGALGGDIDMDIAVAPDA